MKRFSALCLLSTAMLLGACASTQMSAPESAGISSQALTRLDSVLKAEIAAGGLPGTVMLISRHGKVVAFDSYGYQNFETKTHLAKDTIFRIASMTKPIVGVAMMMLFEEGKWKLDDPVARYIPPSKSRPPAARSPRCIR